MIISSLTAAMKSNYLLLELEDCIKPEWPKTRRTNVLGRFLASLGDDFDEYWVIAPVATYWPEAAGARRHTH